MQEKLFKDLLVESFLDTPHEPPKTVLAMYVLVDLPRDLKECKDLTSFKELAKRQQTVLLNEAERIRAIRDKRVASETQLDLMMLLNGFLPTGDDFVRLVPPLLLSLIEENAHRHSLARRMTYELIIDVNVSVFLRTGQLRVFTVSNSHERDFYLGHFFAEKHIRRAYELLEEMVEGKTMKASSLRTIITDLKEFTAYMNAFAGLSYEEYARFRRFLTVYPEGTRNASGAFMPSPQLFEMLLTNPTSMQQVYITQNLEYFSIWAQPLMKTLLRRSQDGNNIETQLSERLIKLTEAETTLLNEVIEEFIQFKLTHIKVVTSKIPKAFPAQPVIDRDALRTLLTSGAIGDNSQQGTGGFNPQIFLAEGICRLLDLQDRLQAQD